MKCQDPILCYNDGIKKKFRHFSLSSPIFKIQSNIVFNCGQCIACRKRRAQELAMRCVLQASLSEENCFLTLTYDEKIKGYKNVLTYTHIQNFKKSLRRHCDYHLNKKIQIFNVHEYGKNGKKHWHLVVFNYDFKDKQLYTTNNQNRLYTSSTLKDLWPYGHHTIGAVSEASALYQAQYTQKDLTYGNQETTKAHSKHAGIGKEYFLKHYEQILSLGYIPFNNKKYPIPRYFQKLAHKHYSHFYQNENFFDTPQRKKLYTPFKIAGQANKQIADLFQLYQKQRETLIQELTTEWEQNLQPFSTEMTDFQLSAENYLYDLKNKIGDTKCI